MKELRAFSGVGEDKERENFEDIVDAEASKQASKQGKKEIAWNISNKELQMCFSA